MRYVFVTANGLLTALIAMTILELRMSPERNGIDNRELNTAFRSPGDSFVYPRIARLFLPFPKSPACSCVSIRLPCCILGLWPKHLEGSKSESSRRYLLATRLLRGTLTWSRDATTFGVFYWRQVKKFDVLLNSAAPNGPDYIDILGLCLHAAPLIS